MQPEFYLEKILFDQINSSLSIQPIFQEISCHLINQNFEITSHLMQHQNFLSLSLRKARNYSDSSSNNEQNLGAQNNIGYNESPQNFENDSRMFNEQENQVSKKQYKEQPLKNRSRIKYQDQESQQFCLKKASKSSETKNTIKNYSKSLFLFIKKKQAAINKILQKLKTNFTDFFEEVQRLTGKINNIKQLRDLWCDNKFQKQFRMISDHFLRKRYPHHIFNSRITNHFIHLKYRSKLTLSVQNPKQFTSLKQD